jgi:hypothetical protein
MSGSFIETHQMDLDVALSKIKKKWFMWLKRPIGVTNW